MGRSTLRLLVLAIVVVIALALASCGGDSKDKGGTATPVAPDASPTPAGTTVVSDDGALSVFIPDGAMPEGTQVSIAAVAHDALPIELSQLIGSGTGYRLEPDGLVLSQPATATLTLQRSELDEQEGSQSAYALASFNDANGREVLDSETTHTLGEDSVTVQAEIAHFSWITRTKGSLLVALQVVPRRQAVGGRFNAGLSLGNSNSDVITLLSIEARLGVSGTVEFGPGAQQTIGIEKYDVTGEHTFYTDYVCARPGVGAYGARVTALSSLIADPRLDTQLAVAVDSTVECVEGTVGPPPTSPPRATAPPGPILHLQQNIGCEHTNPGVSSELQKRGRITDEAGLPVAGILVYEDATGPGLRPGGDEEDIPGPAVRSSGLTDDNGEFFIRWTIVSGGPYTTTVSRLAVDGGVNGTLDGSSTTSSQYTVAAVCVPPAPVR